MGLIFSILLLIVIFTLLSMNTKPPKSKMSIQEWINHTFAIDAWKDLFQAIWIRIRYTFSRQPKLPPKDLPPSSYFEVAFEADLHAMFILMIIELNFVYDINSLNQFHDLKKGALTRTIKSGYVAMEGEKLSLTYAGRDKLNSMRKSGLICRGK